MTPWVLLRGLTRESRHWGGFPAKLGESLGGAPVVCLDLPGNGRLNALDSLRSVEAMADYCHAELVGLGMSGSCRVLAMSLGAMVAAAWARRHPGDIGAAVLINTSLRPFSPFHQRLRPANYPRVLRLLVGPADARTLETEILRMTTRLVAEPQPVIEEWLRWRRESPVSRRNAIRQLLAAASYRAPHQSPFARLLVLAGAGDTLVNPRCSQVLAAQWQARLAMHPAGGHDLPLDDESWVLTQILDWLRVLGSEVAAPTSNA
jgi:pimeloyl-ACP methyl ester carboxylesterase